VGTTSIENSERVSRLLKVRKVPHQILNAKHHEREAYIVAQAGHLGAVTVATNMAGRGTDIMLGGNPEFLAREKLLNERPSFDWKIKALDRDDVYNYFVQYTSVLPEDLTRNYLRDRGLTAAAETGAPGGEYSDFLLSAFTRIKRAHEAYLEEFRARCQEEHDRVVELGGLAIVGTERHEARRIDNQLRGRAGRQGDPGESRFYMSLEDDLLRLFGSERVQGLMTRLGMTEGEAIESPMLTKVIESSQHKVEQMHFDIRKQLLAYDNVMNQQREAVYSERYTILEQEGIVDYGWGIVRGVVEEILDRYFPEREEPDPERAAHRFRAILGPGGGETVLRLDSRSGMELVRDEIIESVNARYKQKITDLTPEGAGDILRYVVLNTLDAAWRDHLLAMDELRRGIGLRAIGQKDPLLEYQFESYNLFQEMMLRVRESFTEQFFRVRVVSENHRERRRFLEGRHFPLSEPLSSDLATADPLFQASPAMRKAQFSLGRDAESGRQEPVKKSVKIGRNAPCPCGSGKKYKHCCGKSV
jgi:preprotein translocase subunit SecA